MMPGVQIQDIWNAISNAYNEDSLRRMLRIQFGQRLDNIVAPKAFRDMVFDLIEVAEREGWDTELVCKSYLFNSGNPSLRTIYEKYGLGSALEAQSDQRTTQYPTTAALEKIINESNPAVDINTWRTRLTALELRVCRVDINESPSGTGFLVGPDVVITNFHVVDTVLNGGDSESALSCLFDYKILADGTRKHGQRMGLHPERGILAHSPCTAGEQAGEPDRTLPKPTELDFALLRLEKKASDETPLDSVTPRGFECLPTAPFDFKVNQPIIIVQHPRGRPLKVAIASKGVIGVNANQTRVRYRTNTEAGSSGSPVFDINFNLTALHHVGDPAYDHPPQFNQGVAPLNLIRNAISSEGYGGLLG